MRSQLKQLGHGVILSSRSVSYFLTTQARDALNILKYLTLTALTTLMHWHSGRLAFRLMLHGNRVFEPTLTDLRFSDHCLGMEIMPVTEANDDYLHFHMSLNAGSFSR